MYETAGHKWKEEDFHDRWIFKHFGEDWDYWYEKNLVPRRFCALCGDDSIREDLFWVNNHSKYGVRIFLCEDCIRSKGQSVPEPKTETPYHPQSFHLPLIKHSFVFFGTIIFWSLFVPKSPLYTLPIFFVNLVHWIGGWLASICINEVTFYTLMPPLIVKNIKTFLRLVAIIKFLPLVAIIWAFFLSSSTGIVTILATIWSFFYFPYYWVQTMKKRGLIGV